MTIPLPAWFTKARLALAALCVIVSILVWPKSDHSPDPAVENGYRVAKRLPSLRRETAERMRAYEAETLRTNAVAGQARHRLQAVTTAIGNSFGAVPAVPLRSLPDSVVVVGHPQVGDTLVLLPIARAKLQELADSANAMMGNLIGAVEIERGRVALVMQSYQRTIAAQDTVIAGLQAELRKRPPFWLRGLRGVEALGVGAACGGLGYIAFGPLGALGAAVACAAIDGVVR